MKKYLELPAVSEMRKKLRNVKVPDDKAKKTISNKRKRTKAVFSAVKPASKSK